MISDSGYFFGPPCILFARSGSRAWSENKI